VASRASGGGTGFLSGGFAQRKFEHQSKNTASWENANLKKSARGAERAARIGFERDFLAKRKRIYQRRARGFFIIYMLATIDFFIIGAYILSVILIGYFASRKQSSESFLISERKLGILSGISTINATKTGAIIFVFTALLYEYGFSAMWYFIGIVLGYLVFLPFAKSLFSKSNARYYTLADYFHENYGTLSGRLVSVITILTMVGFLIINLITAAKVLEFFAGMNFAFAAVIVAVVVMLYLLLAGFSAVVKTDVLQYLAIIFR